MNIRVVPPTLVPCPTCKQDTAALKDAGRRGANGRKLWRVECTACESYGVCSVNKSQAVTWWNRGDVLTPLAAARVEREFSQPCISRGSFPGLGQPASRYPLISRISPERRIRFCPGKYGRVDKFYLEEGGKHPDFPKEYSCLVEMDTEPGEETLAILRELDQHVADDPELISSPLYQGGLLWFLFPRKGKIEHRGNDSAALYERRLIQQERLLSGEIKRGHKAFGFLPLDGYR